MFFYRGIKRIFDIYLNVYALSLHKNSLVDFFFLICVPTVNIDHPISIIEVKIENKCW